MSGRDTIFAISTPPGRSGIAVLRLSGSRSKGALAALGAPGDLEARRARLVDLARPGDGEAIDRGLVLFFPGPQSATGEDVGEVHLHGGPAVVKAALEALAGLDGLRPAEPGEFTRRAFDNGKLDLSEVEGLADLIAAETEAQRRQALKQMRGALSELTEGWRYRLLQALAQAEAAIDFPEEDLPEDLWSLTRALVEPLKDELLQHLSDSRGGERLRHGYQIAILGAPNVGKSSLLNAVAQRDVAIVAETAGTTRDVIEVHLDLGGYPVTLMDTAGLRAEADDGTDEAAESAKDATAGGRPAEPIGAVEAEGMRRARVRGDEADMRLLVADVRDWPDLGPAVEPLVDETAVVVLNKADLAPAPEAARYRGRPLLALSAREGTGLEGLLGHLEAGAKEGLGVAGAAASVTRVRHRRAIEDCHSALSRALAAADAALAAEDLRLAVRALGRITGRVDVEDLLDVLFKEFCIGK